MRRASEARLKSTFQHTASKFGKETANKQAVAVALSQARKSKQPPGPEESPRHEAAESPSFEKQEHRPKHKVRKLFGRK